MTIYFPGSPSPQIAVTREYLHLDDASKLGSNAIDYSSSADQSAKLIAALAFADAATGGDRCIFQGGPILNAGSAEIVWPNSTIRWLGAGRELASIKWPGSAGADKFGFKLPTSSDFSLEEVTLVGSAYGSPTPIGGMPNLTRAIHIQTRGTVRRVSARGWAAGAGIVNDHMKLAEVDFRGNTYGLDFMDNPVGGLGDFLCEGLSLFTDQSRASIAIASTNSIANGRFLGNGHCGAAPFGIYRYQALNAATGSAASATITGVNVAYTPTVGMQVNGRNIPTGTVVASGGVAGVAGNWSLTLSNTPTGTVTSVELGRRGTVLQGIEFENWSFEYCGQSMFYDELAYLSAAGVAETQGQGSDGSWTKITFSQPAEFATGGSADWSQDNVAATGGTGSNNLTGVAVTAFTPDRTMVAIGTNIPNVVGGGSLITNVTGTSGNYTLTLANTPTGVVAAASVGKPKELANMEIGDVDEVTWTAAGPAIQGDAPLQPYVRGKSIKKFRGNASSVLASGPDGHKSIQIRPGARGGAEVSGMEFGTVSGWRTGAILISAKLCNEALSRGDLLDDRATNGRVQRCRPGNVPVGFAMGDYEQYDVAFYVMSGAYFQIFAHNRSAGSVAKDKYVKPDQTANSANYGGIVESTGLSDGPIVGFTYDAIIPPGTTGKIAAMVH